MARQPTDDGFPMEAAAGPPHTPVDEERSPTNLLSWAADRYFPRIALTSSFGLEDVILCHMASQIEPDFPIIFIDTGFLFPETLSLKERLVDAWDLNLTTLQPDLSVLEQDAAHGERLFMRNPDRCCGIRKVEPLRRALKGLDAWVTGMRRQQSPTRRHLQQVEQHETEDGRIIAKLNPLAFWRTEQVREYAQLHDLPYNPLHDEGYPSIGCFPCTRAVLPGEDERAGRWSGRAKTECGLHNITVAQDNGGTQGDSR